MTDPYAALEAANIGLANVLSYRTYSGSRTPGRVEWDSAQRALDLVRAALDARPEPVAWQTQCPVRLTDEQIAFCLFEARVQSGPFKRDGSTSFRFARAVEAEVLRLNGIGGDDE